jgi:hypothetical protein
LPGSQASAHLDPIAEQGVVHSNGDAQHTKQALENGNGAPEQEDEQYETLTFHVGGEASLVHFKFFVQSLLPYV